LQSAIVLSEPQRGAKYAGFFGYDCALRVIDAVGPIAQSVEQRTFNPWVDGSSPSGPTDWLIQRDIKQISLHKVQAEQFISYLQVSIWE
jgi:hypothetical protein